MAGNGNNVSLQSSQASLGVFFLVVALHAITILIGLIGNTLLGLTIACNSSLRTATNTYILGIALVDLLTCILLLPVRMALQVDIYAGQELAAGVYTTEFFLRSCTDLVRLLLMQALSVERYQAIAKPFSVSKAKASRRALVISLAIWTVSLGTSLLVVRYFCDSVVFSSCTVDYSARPGAPIAVSTNTTDVTHDNVIGGSSVWGNFEVYLELPLTLVVAITTLTSYGLMLLVLRKHKHKMSRHSKPKANQVTPATEVEGSGRSQGVVQMVQASDAKGGADATTKKKSKGIADSTGLSTTTINVTEANERKETTGKVVKIEDNDNLVVQISLAQDSLGQDVGSVVSSNDQRTAYIAADSDGRGVRLLENLKGNHNHEGKDSSALKVVSVESSLTWHDEEIPPLYDKPKDKTNLGVFDVANSTGSVTICSTASSPLADEDINKAELTLAEVSHGVSLSSTSSVDIPSSTTCWDVSKTPADADKVQSIDNEVANPLLSPNTHKLTSPLSSVKSTTVVPPTSMSDDHLVLGNKSATLKVQTTLEQAALSTHAQQDVHTLRPSSTSSTSTNMTSINSQILSKVLTSCHNTTPMDNTIAGQSNCGLTTQQTLSYAMESETKHRSQDKETHSSQSLALEHSEASLLRSTNNNLPLNDSSENYVGYSGADYGPGAVGSLVSEKYPHAGQFSDRCDRHAMIGTDKQSRHIADLLKLEDSVISAEPLVENSAPTPIRHPSGNLNTPCDGIANIGFTNDEFESTGSNHTTCDIQALEKEGYCTHSSLSVHVLHTSSSSQCQLSRPLIENKTATAVDLIKNAEHLRKLHGPNGLTEIQSYNVDQCAKMEPIQRKGEMGEVPESFGSLNARADEKNNSTAIGMREAEVPKTPQKAIEVVEMDGTVHMEIVKQEANTLRVEGAVCLMNPRNREQGRRRVELKVALKVGLLFCCFICLWMPLFIAVLVLRGKTGLSMTARTDTVYVTATVGTCLAAVDPIIYGLSNAQIRTALKTSARKLKRIITGYVGRIRAAACTKRVSYK